MLKNTSSCNVQNSKYVIKEAPGGVEITTPLVNGNALVSHRRQCAEFCNDAIGIPSFFTDLLTQKKTRITSQTPHPASVAILDVGTKYGHVIFMEREVTPDVWVYSESNYDDQEHFRRMTGSISDLKKRGLLGFTDGVQIVQEVSEWAEESVLKASSKIGVTGEPIIANFTRPHDEVTVSQMVHIFYKLGALNSPDGVLSLERVACALDRLKLLEPQK